MESKTVKLVKTESRMVAARVWRVGDMGKCWSQDAEVQLDGMSKFWRPMYNVVTKVNNTVL